MIKSFARLTGLLAIIGTLTTINTAQAKPTLKDYGTLPEIQSIAISPSSDLVAFRKVTSEYDRLSVISISSRKPIANIDVKEIQPRSVYFLNEEQLVLTASEYKKIDGFIGQHNVSTAFLYNLKDKSIRQLLIPGQEPVISGQTGLGRIIGLSADGVYAYMPAYSFVKADSPSFKGEKLQDPDYSIIRVNLKERKPPGVFSKGTNSTYDFFVDDKNNVLAQISYDQRSNIHRVRTRQNGEWADIFKETVEIPEKSFVGVTPDFKSLVVLDTNEKTGRIAYYTMSLTDGTLSEPIFGRDDADIEATVNSFQRVVYGVRYSGFTPSYQFLIQNLTSA